MISNIDGVVENVAFFVSEIHVVLGQKVEKTVMTFTDKKCYIFNDTIYNASDTLASSGPAAEGT